MNISEFVALLRDPETTDDIAHAAFLKIRIEDDKELEPGGEFDQALIELATNFPGTTSSLTIEYRSRERAR